MRSKTFIIGLAAVSVLAFTGLAYAQQGGKDIPQKAEKVVARAADDENTDGDFRDTSKYQDMFKAMESVNGDEMTKMHEDFQQTDAWKKMLEAYKEGKDPSEILTDEEYQAMIDFMRENGYGDMADYMDSIDPEDMIEMHESMHGENSFGDMFNGSTSGCH